MQRRSPGFLATEVWSGGLAASRESLNKKGGGRRLPAPARLGTEFKSESLPPFPPPCISATLAARVFQARPSPPFISSECCQQLLCQW